MTSPDWDLDAFIETASGLESGALLELGVEPSSAEAAELARARTAARTAAGAQGLARDFERVGDEIMRWSSAGGALSGVYSFASPPGDIMLADLRGQAIPALLDAALALLLHDSLDPNSSRALLARWQGVTDSGA
jgi:hypothetical protein